MATYGTRDATRFSPGGNLGKTQYYTLIDSGTGNITLKSPTIAGDIGGASADRTVGSIPAKGTFQITPGSTTSQEKEFFSKTENVKSVKNQAIITATKSQVALGVDYQTARTNSEKLINSETTVSQSIVNNPTVGSSIQPQNGKANLSEIEDPNVSAKKSQEEGSFGNWRYPIGIGDNDQDFIKFSMFEYTTRTLSALKVGDRKVKKRLGTVILPIQPSITDINTVDWQSEGINPLQIAGTRVALDVSSPNAEGAVPATLDNLINQMKGEGENIKNYLRLWAAGKAVNINLLSRVAGAAVNPNLELLFNGPQLRPFTFTYRLSARNKDESARIRSIIRFFKQGMAVRKSESDIFLKTPNIFEIKYCYKKDDERDHPGLNKIKLCALTSCNVDYAPDGSYATFADGSMTSYGLTLQFTELEPVYSDDYGDMSIGENTANSIGY